MTAPNIDLSPELIRSLCKGDVSQLPRLWVHDNAVWPPGVIRIDALNRIHMRRRDFEITVSPSIPVREGIWMRSDVQEFIIDLRPDQLGGDADQHTTTNQADRRVMVKADASARIPGEEDYGDDQPAAIRAPKRPGELPETLGAVKARTPSKLH